MSVQINAFEVVIKEGWDNEAKNAWGESEYRIVGTVRLGDVDLFSMPYELHRDHKYIEEDLIDELGRRLQKLLQV